MNDLTPHVLRECLGIGKDDLHGKLSIQVQRACTTPRASTLEPLLRHITFRGVAALCGVRTTEGSVDLLPPPRSQLLVPFSEPWHVDGRRSPNKPSLTVGARAWTKHAGRSSRLWWGDPHSKGGDGRKNAEADRCINMILDKHAWLNVHALPCSESGDGWKSPVPVVELRIEEGYGARWTADAAEFRGFVEPMIADGHSKRWRS